VRKDSVLISGIGIAGPALAYWLREHGYEPTLVERAPHPRSSGYVIDFWGAGYDIAGKMGLLPGLKRECYAVEEVRFVDAKGHRISSLDVDVFRSLTGGRYISIPRADLARLLLEKVMDRCEIIFGGEIAAIEQTDKKARVAFKQGTERQFDLVIGADGLHSRVRNLVFGNRHRYERYLGYVAAAFEAEGYRPRDEGVYVSYAVPGKQVSRFALRDDRTLFFFIFAALPDVCSTRDAAAQRALLREEFGGIGWECPNILAAIDDKDLYFDRVSQIELCTWSQGRVALIGDAAFCPSLLAGQGAALAMLSAYVLAGELTERAGQPEAAFQRYEQLLRPLIASKQRAARRFAGSFAPKTAFGVFLRNQLIKFVPRSLLARAALGSLADRIKLPDYSGHSCG